jgi:hypothetical protein
LKRATTLALVCCQTVEYAIAAGLALIAMHLQAPGRDVLLAAAAVLGGLAALTAAPLGVLKVLRLQGHRLMLALVPIALVVAAGATFRPAGLLPAGALVLVAAALVRLRAITPTGPATDEAAWNEGRPSPIDAAARTAGRAAGRGLRSGEDRLHKGAYLLGRLLGGRDR